MDTDYKREVKVNIHRLRVGLALNMVLQDLKSSKDELFLVDYRRNCCQ